MGKKSIKKKILLGLCGNFNSIQADDFITVSGSPEATAVDFANGWKSRANCPDVKNSFEDPCSLRLDNGMSLAIDGNEIMMPVLSCNSSLLFFIAGSYAKKWCSLLSDPNGVFAPCHKEISLDFYQMVS